ncbi:MAG TPA: neutral/alkaline non-lysosomal ceramidase N-terminal domain-containing protein [Calidithermus sp.]|nr:neutral/alkaline non-lysosomal ceramidase N-terminal domain-containing protein [Calidithermus sp.]
MKAARLLAGLLVVLAAGRAAAGPEPLLAGAATVALPVPAGTPLAGYGAAARRLPVPDLLGRHAHAFWFRPHQGRLDDPGVRALVLETPRTRLVWLAVDVVAVDRTFTARVARALADAGLAPGRLLVSASHTHSGPGAFLDAGLLFGLLAVDRLDAEVHQAVVDALVEAVRQAERHKRPARLGSGTVAGPALTVGRLDDPVDRSLTVLKVLTADGQPLAVVWNYAIHGTMLGPRNLRLSGDVMGLAARQIERALGVPALFVNGAVGDVSPVRHGVAEAQAAARTLADAVVGAWRAIAAGPGATLAVRTARVELGRPRLSLRGCLGGWVPSGFVLPLDGLLPADAELIAVGTGDTAWVTVPGELQSALGEAIKDSARPSWRRVFVVGLTNDYLGYFLTPAAAAGSSYVACANLYGPEAGRRLARAAADALRTLAAER